MLFSTRDCRVFSREQPDFSRWFDEYSTMDYAKSGFVATETVTIPAGKLPDLQSTMEPVLRKLGLPTQLEKGKIVLREDYVVCTEGAKLTPEHATILKHLAKPMSEFKITILCMWSKDGKFEKYKKIKTPARLVKLIESKQVNTQRSKKSEKKKQKASANENEDQITRKVKITENESSDLEYGEFVLRYEEENNSKANVSDDDDEEGIVEDHSDDGEGESDDSKSDDGTEEEKMDEDGETDEGGEMAEDEGMHEDEEMQYEEKSNESNLLSLKSEDVEEELNLDSEEKIISPREKSPKKTEKEIKTPNQNTASDKTSPFNKSLRDKTPKQKSPIASPSKQHSSNTKASKTTTPKVVESPSEAIIEPSQENKSSDGSFNTNLISPKKNNKKCNTSDQNGTLPNLNHSHEESSQETTSTNEGNKLKSPKAQTPKKPNTPKANENSSSDEGPIEESSSSQRTTSLSQESTEFSQETKASSQEESGANSVDSSIENSPKKTQNIRKRKVSTSKQTKKSPQKLNRDEDNKTEPVPATNPSPKITKSNPRRSLRTPKPIKRTPPKETKPSDAVTGSAKRLRSTPMKGTPQKANDTPKRTARRKSIFPPTEEDVEMK